jgi:hypothetical protein
MLQYTPWLLIIVAIIIAVHYAREAAKYREMDSTLRASNYALMAGAENLRRSVDYYKDQNNRLRLLSGLDYREVGPHPKVIVLKERRLRRYLENNPLKPRGL